MRAAAALLGGARAAARGRRSGSGGLERRGDDGRGRRNSDVRRALFDGKVHGLKVFKKEKDSH